MWGQLGVIQGGHLKIRGIWKNSYMRGHSKFLGGLRKALRGARLSGGLLQRGVQLQGRIARALSSKS